LYAELRTKTPRDNDDDETNNSIGIYMRGAAVEMGGSRMRSSD